MAISEAVFALDQKQRHDQKDAVACAKNPTHGRLMAAIDGVTLFCKCGYSVPVAVPMLQV